MITDDKVIEIYSLTDDFIQVFSTELQKRTISNSKPTRTGRKSIMLVAEVSIVDSTTLQVCRQQRVHCHKVLRASPNVVTAYGVVFRAQAASNLQRQGRYLEF